MSRKSNTEERQALIVDALRTVIATHGYEKATTQLIARQAGLTPGLIHYHFASKQEILLALVKTLADGAQARFDHFASQAMTPEARLQAWLDSRLALGDGENPAAVAAWVAIGAEAIRQPEVREIYQAVVARELDMVQQLLGACAPVGRRTATEIRDFAAALLTFAEGAFQLACATRGLMPQGYAAGVAQWMVAGFLADGNPQSS